MTHCPSFIKAFHNQWHHPDKDERSVILVFGEYIERYHMNISRESYQSSSYWKVSLWHKISVLGRHSFLPIKTTTGKFDRDIYREKNCCGSLPEFLYKEIKLKISLTNTGIWGRLRSHFSWLTNPKHLEPYLASAGINELIEW